MSTAKMSRKYFVEKGREGGRRSAAAVPAKVRAANGRKGAMARWYEYCGNCDGVGWIEGGKTLQTTCYACDGSGMVRRRA